MRSTTEQLAQIEQLVRDGRITKRHLQALLEGRVSFTNMFEVDKIGDATVNNALTNKELIELARVHPVEGAREWEKFPWEKPEDHLEFFHVNTNGNRLHMVAKLAELGLRNATFTELLHFAHAFAGYPKIGSPAINALGTLRNWGWFPKDRPGCMSLTYWPECQSHKDPNQPVLGFHPLDGLGSCHFLAVRATQNVQGQDQEENAQKLRAALEATATEMRKDLRSQVLVCTPRHATLFEADHDLGYGNWLSEPRLLEKIELRPRVALLAPTQGENRLWDKTMKEHPGLIKHCRTPTPMELVNFVLEHRLRQKVFINAPSFETKYHNFYIPAASFVDGKVHLFTEDRKEECKAWKLYILEF